MVNYFEDQDIVHQLKIKWWDFQVKRNTKFFGAGGLSDDTIYPNGISTSLPRDIQEII